MAPRWPASVEPLDCRPICSPPSQVDALRAGAHRPAELRAQDASPVLLALGVVVLVPPAKEPLLRCCPTSQAAARLSAARNAGRPRLVCHSWITAYDVASGSAALFLVQLWFLAEGLAKVSLK